MESHVNVSAVGAVKMCRKCNVFLSLGVQGEDPRSGIALIARHFPDRLENPRESHVLYLLKKQVPVPGRENRPGRCSEMSGRVMSDSHQCRLPVLFGKRKTNFISGAVNFGEVASEKIDAIE